MIWSLPLIILSFLFLGIAILLFPDESWARAGGSVGRGLSLWIWIILGPVILIYSAIVSYFLSKKRKECKTLLEKIGGGVPHWSPSFLKSRIEETFFKVQEGWQERNHDQAKDYMSAPLLLKHQEQTNAMLERGHKNMMEDISLEKATIVQIADFRDDAKDSFIAYLSGEMIDYVIDEKTGDLIKGEKDRTAFAELWKFTRKNNQWVVDEITPNVAIDDLSSLSSFSEELETQKDPRTYPELGNIPSEISPIR